MSLDRQPKTFHVSLAVSYVTARARRPRALDDLLNERGTGRPIPGEEVLSIARECAERGFSMIPSCDHVGPDGGCLGHPVEATA
jgi:hypothetical protein